MVLVSSESKKHNALKVMILEPREIKIRRLLSLRIEYSYVGTNSNFDPQRYKRE